LTNDQSNDTQPIAVQHFHAMSVRPDQPRRNQPVV